MRALRAITLALGFSFLLGSSSFAQGVSDSGGVQVSLPENYLDRAEVFSFGRCDGGVATFVDYSGADYFEIFEIVVEGGKKFILYGKTADSPVLYFIQKGSSDKPKLVDNVSWEVDLLKINKHMYSFVIDQFDVPECSWVKIR